MAGGAVAPGAVSVTVATMPQRTPKSQEIASLGTAWMAVVFVLLAAVSTAPLFHLPSVPVIPDLLGDKPLTLVVVPVLSAALVAGYEFLRRRS
jgi:hypothetical protein